MHIPAALADGTLCDAVPLIEVEEVEERCGKLDLVLPEDPVGADRATELPALDFDGAKLLRFTEWRHGSQLLRCWKSLLLLKAHSILRALIHPRDGTSRRSFT
jgi:hypothetical protein